MRPVIALGMLLAACSYDGRAATDAPGGADAPAPADARADAEPGAIDAGVADADTLLDGLVAWYPMDDLPGGVMTDATGHGHDGTCTSCPEVMPGQVGGAYRFSSDRLDVPGGGALETAAAFTVAAWIQFATVPGSGYACALGKLRAGSVFNTWQLCYQAAGSRWYFGTQGAGTNVIGYQPAPTAGTWYHAAMVWDGAGKALWLDGVKVATSSQTDLAFDGSAIVIGADEDNGSTAHRLDGWLDDVRIYDRALLDGEIAQLATP